MASFQEKEAQMDQLKNGGYLISETSDIDGSCSYSYDEAEDKSSDLLDLNFKNEEMAIEKNASSSSASQNF